MDTTTTTNSQRPATPGPAAPRAQRRASGLAAGLVLALIFCAAAAPLILSRGGRTRAAFDQNKFHLPAIREFAEQWPRFDVRDYSSATTPGYHIVVATVARLLGDDERLLRAAGAAFTVGLLLTLAVAVVRRSAASNLGTATTVLLCLPLVCSLYVFSSGAWLLPDNAGWWGVLAVLLIALRPRWNVTTAVAGALALVALVLMRQVHLWTAGLLWVAAWVGSGSDARGSPLSGTIETGDARPLARRLALALAATLPAVIVVAAFAYVWGGLVPPAFQPGKTRAVAGEVESVAHQGLNAAVPAFVLALVGIFGLFYAGFLLPRATTLFRTYPAARRRTVLVGAIVGLVVGVIPKTSYDLDAGRYSGLWNVVRVLPAAADRSPLIIALSTLGGIILALWWLCLGRRDRSVFFAAWLLFILAQTANAMAWQRYYEPFILMMLALMSARAAGAGEEVRAASVLRRLAPIGPALLAALLAAVTALELRPPKNRSATAPDHSRGAVDSIRSTPAMPQFIRIGDSLIALEWIRAVEYAGDGRLQIFLSEDRHGGLVMRYSGAEAEAAWATLCDARRIALINGEDAPPVEG